LVGFQDVCCFDWPTKDAAELTRSETEAPALAATPSTRKLKGRQTDEAQIVAAPWAATAIVPEKRPSRAT
jgi:hypothetical protein